MTRFRKLNAGPLSAAPGRNAKTHPWGRAIPRRSRGAFQGAFSEEPPRYNPTTVKTGF